MALNRDRAADWCAWIATTFHVATVADWIVLSSKLVETPENRAFGLECDKALIERCDELWMVGPRVSSGMTIEAQHARLYGLPVYDLTGMEMNFTAAARALETQGRRLGCGTDCDADCTHGRTDA